MDREQHEELVRRYATRPEDLTPEQRAKRDEVMQRMEAKRERGEVLSSWSKENFPIGLDSNFKPFPVRKRGDLPGTDESSDQSENHDGN